MPPGSTHRDRTVAPPGSRPPPRTHSQILADQLSEIIVEGMNNDPANFVDVLVETLGEAGFNYNDLFKTDAQSPNLELSIALGGKVDAEEEKENETGIGIKIDPINVTISDNELTEVLPRFIEEFEALRANRVAANDHLDREVYADKFMALYNWYTLLLGIIHSSGMTQTELFRIIFGYSEPQSYRQIGELASRSKVVHTLLNHCGFALLVYPDWFSLHRLMSKRYSVKEREQLMTSQEVLTLDQTIRESGQFADAYAIMESNINILKDLNIIEIE